MKTLNDIISEVSRETRLPEALVEKTYRAYWKAVREHIVNLPLKQELTDEEFKLLQPNVNIPSLGKLHVTLERYKKVKKSFHKIEELKNLKEKENASH